MNSQTGEVKKEFLEKNNVVAGERGVYRNKERTYPISPESDGVTVAVRHTPGKYGGKYPDILDDDGLLYHYPETTQLSHDRADINATKQCMAFKLPIFVVLSSEKKSTKKVKLGWVLDFDDEEKIFLIDFGEKKTKYRF